MLDKEMELHQHSKSRSPKPRRTAQWRDLGPPGHSERSEERPASNEMPDK
jgi:hypothetical protein